MGWAAKGCNITSPSTPKFAVLENVSKGSDALLSDDANATDTLFSEDANVRTMKAARQDLVKYRENAHLDVNLTF